VSISGIRSGLAASLGTVTGLRVSDYFPDEINPPMAIVDTYQIAFDSAYNRGSDEITFDVLVVVKRSSERAAQQSLDTYVPLVKAALENNPSLGGAADDVHVTAMNGYAPLNQGEITYLAATFAVRVIATA
jgi:hypothetical protein